MRKDVLTREAAVGTAAFWLIEAREKASMIHGWLTRGEGKIGHLLSFLAGGLLEALQQAYAMAAAFAPSEGSCEEYEEAVAAFFEEARLEAEQRIALRRRLREQALSAGGCLADGWKPRAQIKPHYARFSRGFQGSKPRQQSWTRRLKQT